MAINRVAVELEDVDTLTGAWTHATATGSSYRASYERGSMVQVGADVTAGAVLNLPSAKTTQGLSARFGATLWDYNDYMFFGVSSGGTNILGVATTTTTGYLRIVRWNGATWDTLDTGAKPTVDQPFRLDVYIESFGASGRVRVWLTYTNGSAPAQLWLDTGAGVDLATGTGATDFDGIWVAGTRPEGTNGGGNPYYNSFSEIVAADEPTLRLHVPMCYPNAAGDTNDWTGAYTDVDEMNADSATFTESDAAAELFLANITDIPASTTLTPLGVQVTALAAKGATGPTQIKLAIKTHGIVYYSSTFALDVAYVGYSYLWAVNPNTSAAWTQAEITDLQIGYESVA